MLPFNGTHTTTTIRLSEMLPSNGTQTAIINTLGNVTSQRETHDHYEQTRKCYLLTVHTRPLLSDWVKLPCIGTQTTVTNRLGNVTLQRDTHDHY